MSVRNLLTEIHAGKTSKPFLTIYNCSVTRDLTPPTMKNKDPNKDPTPIKLDVWWAARMLLVYLLDKATGWKANVEHIANETGFNEKTIRNYFSILIAAGYMSRIEIRNSLGQVVRVSYTFSDCKGTEGRDVRITLPKGLSDDHKSVYAFVDNYIKNGWSYEQEITQEKPAHSTVSPENRQSRSGLEENVTQEEPSHSSVSAENRLADTRLLPPKYLRDSKYQEISNKEDPPRSHVHNSASCKHEQRDGTSLPKREELSLREARGSGIAGASNAARRVVSDRGVQEHEAIDALQQAFPANWREIDILSELISWMQLYVSYLECQNRWDVNADMGKPVKNRFAYYLKALLTYVKNLKDPSLSAVENNLIFMAGRKSSSGRLSQPRIERKA